MNEVRKGNFVEKPIKETDPPPKSRKITVEEFIEAVRGNNSVHALNK